jgi:hypothetical protein
MTKAKVATRAAQIANALHDLNSAYADEPNATAKRVLAMQVVRAFDAKAGVQHNDFVHTILHRIASHYEGKALV